MIMKVTQKCPKNDLPVALILVQIIRAGMSKDPGE
jgi:hypothetical protein